MKTIKLLILLMALNIVVFGQKKQVVTPKQVLSPTETEVLVNVTVTDTKNVPRKKDIVIMIGETSKKTFSGVTDSLGKFSILLPKGDVYKIKYRDFTDSIVYSKFEVAATAGKYTSELTIQIEPPKTYTLENVLFDTGLATLKASSDKALNDLVAVMKLKNALVIEIAGHTDNTGTAAVNLKLSQDRADAVRNYLIKKGISAKRVTAKGYGDTQPVADNTTEAGKAKNRRTEVRIIKE